MTTERQKRVPMNLRLTVKTKERLNAAAEDMGVSQTAVVEIALREFYRERFQDALVAAANRTLDTRAGYDAESTPTG